MGRFELSWRNVRGGDGDEADLVDRVAMERSQDRVDSAEARSGRPLTPRGEG